MADNGKKQVPLRLSAALYEEIASWADADFRSVNGQIEYLLTACVKWRKRKGKSLPEAPPESASEENEIKKQG